MSVKNNLVRCMKDKKMSIRDLALKTGISEPTLKRLRTQPDANPTLDVLMRLSAALNVSINELIQAEKQNAVFYHGDIIELGDHITEFMVLFTKKIFSFQAGSKAIFKKHNKGDPVTKYIVNRDGKLLEKISDENWLFRDEAHNNFSMNEKLIFATIFKELYEVNYV